MPTIKILPPELISKIAAGEVVERPSSVVKELVENAVDAGSMNIAVEIDIGGAALIRVTDDGAGMSAEDARLSVERHTTSKISNFEDLYKLQTLGFRGEALASIASVSQFSVQTRRGEDLSGIKVEKTGDSWQVSDVGCNTGTQVTVKNLFYNVPARRKFLRSAMTEYQHILELMESFGLLFPDIGFKFVSNGKTVFDWPASRSNGEGLDGWKDRCREIIGDTFKDYLPINFDGDFKLRGFIGKPAIARPRREQHLFINNRVVTEHMVSRSIKEAFGDLIAKDCYPPFVLKIELPSEKVDVNVHPRKTEVKIANSHIFYREVFRLVHAAVHGSPLPGSPARLQADGSSSAGSWPSGQSANWPSTPKVFASAVKQSLNFYERLNDLPSFGTPQPVSPAFTVLGQLDNSYILVLVKDAILVFDQHAVSERLIFEELKAVASSGLPKSQQLLQPLNLELSLGEFGAYSDSIAVLNAIGWQTEGFGERTILVRAVPAALRQGQARSVLPLLLKDLASSRAPEELWKSMACHSAVRFGDVLARPEQEKLVHKAFANNVQSCPHGRPVMHKIELEDLHKIFKRRGF